MDAWFALHIHSRREKLIQSALESHGLAQFLPTYKLRKSRSQVVEKSLFPGYLFSRFNPVRRLPVLLIPGVLRILSDEFSRPIPVPDEEIERLRAAVASLLPISPWQYTAQGERVSIESGPMAGYEGIVQRMKSANSCRVILTVELLRRSVAVEVDADALRPLKPQPLRLAA